MCVIVVVRAGQALPTKKELLAMHRQNPHGMGFASKSIQFKTMDFESFYHRLLFVPIDEDVIIHFRYATHGSIGVKNCHPFKRGKVWFAHNGILDIEPVDDKTDSETAFHYIYYPLIKKYGIESDKLREAVEDTIGWSKFAFLPEDGRARLFGNWQEYQGRMYSNLRHLYHARTA